MKWIQPTLRVNNSFKQFSFQQIFAFNVDTAYAGSTMTTVWLWLLEVSTGIFSIGGTVASLFSGNHLIIFNSLLLLYGCVLLPLGLSNFLFPSTSVSYFFIYVSIYFFICSM